VLAAESARRERRDPRTLPFLSAAPAEPVPVEVDNRSNTFDWDRPFLTLELEAGLDNLSTTFSSLGFLRSFSPLRGRWSGRMLPSSSPSVGGTPGPILMIGTVVKYFPSTNSLS